MKKIIVLLSVFFQKSLVTQRILATVISCLAIFVVVFNHYKQLNSNMLILLSVCLYLTNFLTWFLVSFFCCVQISIASKKDKLADTSIPAIISMFFSMVVTFILIWDEFSIWFNFVLYVAILIAYIGMCLTAFSIAEAIGESVFISRKDKFNFLGKKFNK